MPFSEATKDEARKRARFRCCRCHEVGIDVHHIIPQVDGGPDTIDNAAPLCQNCHDRFGDNPRKRKEIRGMRDLWYEIAKEKWPTADDRAERLNEAVRDSETGASDLEAIADALRDELDRLRALLDRPSAAAIREVATGVDSTLDDVALIAQLSNDERRKLNPETLAKLEASERLEEGERAYRKPHDLKARDNLIREALDAGCTYGEVAMVLTDHMSAQDDEDAARRIVEEQLTSTNPPDAEEMRRQLGIA